jgi:hypothetical protein
MQERRLLFVGGSQEGFRMVDPTWLTLTFVNGNHVQPAADGSLGMPLNATLERYVREVITKGDGQPGHAYVLEGLDRDQSRERLAMLLGE